MRIDHLTLSQAGGAGLVAKLLNEALVDLGHDSVLHTLLESNLSEEPFREPKLTVAAGLDRYLLSSDPKGGLVSLFRTRLGQNQRLPIYNKSLIHLHWVEGLVNHSRLENWLRDGKKVVWTLHDMAPFTAICHYSYDCRGYETTCSSCPQVRSIFRENVRVHLSKKLMGAHYQNLKIVAPTNWIAKRAATSAVLGLQDVTVIPNPISNFFFQERSRETARVKLNIQPNETVGIAIAADLEDPRKRIGELAKIFYSCAPAKADTPVRLLLVGRKGEKFHDPTRNIFWLGELAPDELADIAVACDLVLSISRSESAGMTIRECGALGVGSLVLGGSGISEMLTHEKSGYVADNDDEFRWYLSKILAGNISTLSLGQEAKKESAGSKSIDAAERYKELYDSLVTSGSDR